MIINDDCELHELYAKLSNNKMKENGIIK